MAGTRKHSHSTSSFRMPVTAPNSPANANSNRYVFGSPVTPQRVATKSNSLSQNQNQNYQRQQQPQQHEYPKQTPKQTQSTFQPRINKRVLYSPSTPLSNVSSSPYTPFSLRSHASSNNTTPGSAYSNTKSAIPVDADGESLADIAKNWRNRASENGIKVGSSEGDADDESEFLFFFLSKELVNVLVGSNPQKSPSAAGGWTHDLFINSTLIVV